MERAGEGVVTHLEEQYGLPRGKAVTIFCGKGNNGGDGFVVARLLPRRHALVRVFMLAPLADLTRDAAVMYRRFVRTAGRSAVKPFRSADQVRGVLASSDFVIDALAGCAAFLRASASYVDRLSSTAPDRALAIGARV
jgi:NAD(P)H-hydrate epimerase